MNSKTASAHLTNDTETVLRVFGDTEHSWKDPFISLRVGRGDTDVVFLAGLGTADVLCDLASVANEAADTLDRLAVRNADGAR
ncbi:hypothetical protein GTW43_01440 [Streptomyces sp. SID5785]|uniref:hypothetical protein n=1 Tax=Streptomyces sp. SID5785 TaxID=2690309 RepID=UPI001361D177|nr:hypothetical protein [Streptomyces sp. SID5785]MZD03747.1 hypothetical protein [Streptomyces sp. SID5785]